MRRAAVALLLMGTLIVPALAARKPAPQRAEPGAGWSAVPVTGSSGEQLFHRYCWECHGDGPFHPGTQALQAKYHGTLPARLDRRTDLTVEFVTGIVRNGITVMPPARKTEISDAELKALATDLAHGRH
jgi:(+)-pinoresinol hydroxylase